MRYTKAQIEKLVELGALKKIGIDEDGDDILLVTSKCKAIEPELFLLRMDYIGAAAMELWQREFVDIYIEDNIFKLEFKPKAFDQDELDELPENLQQSVAQFKLITEGKI